ncbi:MAG TPA: 4-(cytidine 5'-diphospho)-2-C-methyl-D-erythritol kinase, partial [Prolixibacteraceae bacterium]|nr:4-(cytidine 5'-diphospho)-2-C-methyl-D-erythritol kinase [Prolixibacteraceae bacterium]
MVVFPNSKINLGLNVVERRADGYHNLETVFFPVSLPDVLEVLPATKTQLEISGIHVEGRLETNLVYRAWELLKEDFGIPPVQIFLHKVIPMGAGLGGGSSDGAFMLKLLN